MPSTFPLLTRHLKSVALRPTKEARMSSYFSGIVPLQYRSVEGNSSTAFHHYNPDEVLGGKTMA